jgi:NitT/TauT family transport system substrate-binding protein
MAVRVRWLLPLLAWLSVTYGCGSVDSAPTPLATVRLGVATTSTPPQPNSVLWLALDDGFYRREGLNVIVTTVNGTPAVLKGLLSGNLDVGNVSTESVIRLADTSPGSLVAVGSPDPRAFYLIVSRTDVGSVADLSNRTIAISDVGSLDDLTTAAVLEASGVSSKSVRRIAIGDPQNRVAALVNARVDATTISTGTWLSVSQRVGLKVLMDEQHFFAAAPVLAKVNAVAKTLIGAKKSVIVKFVAALLRATRYYSQHGDSWVRAMSHRRPDLTTSDLATLWEYYRSKWPVDGGLDLGWCKTTAEVLYRTTAFQGVTHVPVEAWTDSSVLRDALTKIESKT